MDNRKVVMNIQDGPHFQDGSRHLYDLSDIGDIGVKSVIFHDAEFKFVTLELTRSFLLSHSILNIQYSITVSFKMAAHVR